MLFARESPMIAVMPAEPIELACDESGSEGENLVGGNTDVFAHASVAVTWERARDCLVELRDRIGSPATEYKANHLLRAKHGSTLEWFLGPSGPIRGQAQVHLTDKRYLLVDRLVAALLEDADTDTATTLYRQGPAAFGPDSWLAFLVASNGLMRSRNLLGLDASVEAFGRATDDLGLARPTGRLGGIVNRLRQAGPRARAYRAQLDASPASIPVLDPLIPAIVATVVSWSRGGRAVSVVHDETNTLTALRVDEIKSIVEKQAPPGVEDIARGELVDLRLVDSQADPRVQLADFLAGVARTMASDELHGRSGRGYTTWLRQYVSPLSFWADERSWAALSQ